MWVHITIVRETPARLEEIVEAGNTESFRNLLLNAPGFRGHYSLTNSDNPAEGYSISIWESAEEGRAFFASAGYAQLMADYKDLITNPPQRLQFRMNWEILSPKILKAV